MDEGNFTCRQRKNILFTGQQHKIYKMLFCSSMHTNRKATCILHLLCTPPPPADYTSWDRPVKERNRTGSVCTKPSKLYNPFHADIVGQLLKKTYLLMFTEKKKKTSPGQQEKRRSLTAESDLLGGGKKAYKGKIKLNQSDGQSSFFYWWLMNSPTLQRLIQGCTFRPRLSSCQKRNKIHTQTVKINLP